jgi:integrase/recombinase XerD
MAWQPQLVRRVDAAGNPSASLGHALVDDYLEFVAARCRPNTLLATAYDLKVFFSVVPKEPTDVVTADIFVFITAQKKPRRGPRIVRLEDGEAGLSARTVKRRLASVSGLFGYLMTRDDLAIECNPVPTGLANRRRSVNRGAPLLRTPRTLPRVLGPSEVEAVLGALNTARDRAMVLAMLLGGLRRCEVLGLRLGDLSPGERRVFIAEGKGGQQRLIPISAQFFTAVGDYLDRERPLVDKPVYTAVNEDEARLRLAEFDEKWGGRYPSIAGSWQRAWSEFVPFLGLPDAIRQVVYTTNAIEALNGRYRRAVQACGHFPTEQAALKRLYLATLALDPTGRGRQRWNNRWKSALNEFDVLFDGRLTAGRV